MDGPEWLDPSFIFDKDTWTTGLATGWAGWTTAVCGFPGLNKLNEKYGIYSAGNSAYQPGFRAAVALGTFGRDAFVAATILKYVGIASSRVAGPGGQSLASWWNFGIDTKVPFRDA